VKGAKLEVYPGAPHGLTTTLADKFNADLLSFLPAQAALADRVVPTATAREETRPARTASDGARLSR